MTDFAELARNEPDTVRRAHFLRMAAGVKALEKLTEKDTRKQDEKRAMIEEMVRIGEANKRAANAVVVSENAEVPGMTDDELRDAITSITGKAPHWKLGREKLLEAYAEAVK